MNVTPKEAQAALNDIQQATKVARIFNTWTYQMIAWGAIWTIGFLISQFQPQWINWIWILLIPVGITGSGILGTMQGRKVRLVPGSHGAFISSRLGIFFGVLYCFTVLWMIIFPLTSAQVSLLWISVVMFGYIIAGIWLQESLSVGLGVGVTLMAVVGYYLLPHYFWLWSAIFAGLPLIGMGIYILKRK